MKKVFRFIRKILILLIFAIGILMCIKIDLFYYKYIYFGVLFYCVLYIFSIIFFKEKWNDIFFIGMIIISCFLTFMYYKPIVNPKFNISTAVGQLQQEIYDENGVAVYYNTKVKENKKIEYIDDVTISEEEAIKSLNKIKEILSFYSKIKPNKIYIVNDFNIDKLSLAGNTSTLKKTVILNNNENLSKTLHHEIGHLIALNTLRIDNIFKFNLNTNSCSIVSDYACENKDELFAETWEKAITENKTTSFSQDISDIFKENIIYFKKPNYISINDFEENLNKLINKEIESFIVKKTDDNMLNSLLQQYPLIKEVNRLDVGDEVLFYNLKED